MGPHQQSATRCGKRQGRTWRTRLQETRIALRLTLKEAAGKLQISIGYLNQLEHGRHDPTLRLAHRIVTVYGKSIWELWTELLPTAPPLRHHKKLLF